MDTLGENLRIIHKKYVPENKDEFGNTIDISDAIKKLYDHINLEIARIQFSDGVYRKQTGEDELTDIKAQIKEAKSNMDNTEKRFNDLNKKLNDTQKEYISILGIFASIVTAFMAGLVFSSSILENMHKSSVYRIVLIALIIGLVLSNLLFGLFYYIDRIVKPKEKSSIKPIAITNIVLIFLIVLTIIAWCAGAVEIRTDFLNDPNNEVGIFTKLSQIIKNVLFSK